MTKKAEKAKEREEAKTYLRELFPPGTTVSTVLRHVSRSGMQRTISVVALDKERGEIHDVSWAVSRVLDMPFDRDRGGVKVGGCGMDMGFHLVYNLSYALYRDGYACLGKGKCPSNYHSNHHDKVKCEGTRVYNPDGPATGRSCYAPSRWWGGDIPENWPRSAPVEVVTESGESVTVPGHLLYCITDDNYENPQVCPTCKGEGYLPNPEGPERFDLIHTDGYALRQRWV